MTKSSFRAGWWPFGGESEDERIQREMEEHIEQRSAELDLELADFIERVSEEAAGDIRQLSERIDEIDGAMSGLDRNDPYYDELRREKRRVQDAIKEVERIREDRIRSMEYSIAAQKQQLGRSAA